MIRIYSDYLSDGMQLCMYKCMYYWVLGMMCIKLIFKNQAYVFKNMIPKNIIKNTEKYKIRVQGNTHIYSKWRIKYKTLR